MVRVRAYAFYSKKQNLLKKSDLNDTPIARPMIRDFSCRLKIFTTHDTNYSDKKST